MYFVGLDECLKNVTHWIALYKLKIKVLYFDSFEVDYITTHS